MSKGMFGPLTPNQDNRAYDLYGIWQPVKLVVRGRGEDRGRLVSSRRSTARRSRSKSTAPSGRSPSRKLTDAKTGEMLAEWTSATLHATSMTRHASAFDGPQAEALDARRAEPLRSTSRSNRPTATSLDKWSQKGRLPHVRGRRATSFYLNGKPYWLRGANQLPYGKNPWDPELPRKLIQLMHDGNIRFTRTHCTPWNEAWLDAADEIGLAVSIEGIRPWAFAGRVDADRPRGHAAAGDVQALADGERGRHQALPQSPDRLHLHGRQRDDAARREEHEEVES